MLARPYIIDVETVPIDGFERYLEEPTAPSNYKDPVKIANYIAEAKADQLASAALDLDLARIVAIGVLEYDPDDDPLPRTNVYTCATADAEKETLELLVDSGVLAGSRLLTYNGWRFDLPLIERRAWYHRFRPPLRIDLDRYRSPHLDIYERTLTKHGVLKAHKLEWYAKRLGWTDPDVIAADAIGAAAKEGRWEDIKEHCRVDLIRTHRLAAFLGVDQ